ncbi:TPA: abortive phage infection protein, partial [Escherichia coli]|nr:abortive phage infection protein [Escherichia coli]
MHPVLNRYIQDLASTLDIAEEQDKLFEYFCNFVVTSKNYLGRFNPVDITTQEDDASIDGLAVLIDSEIILTQEDAIAAFESHKSSLPVELLVIQAKSGETFRKDKIANFNLGLQDLFSLDPKLP